MEQIAHNCNLRYIPTIDIFVEGLTTCKQLLVEIGNLRYIPELMTGILEESLQ